MTLFCPSRACIVGVPLLLALLLAGCETMPSMPEPEPHPAHPALPSDSPLRQAFGNIRMDPVVRYRDQQEFARGEGFRDVVVAVLTEARAFDPQREGRYRLDLLLEEVDEPAFGAVMTVRVRSRFTIVDPDGVQEVFIGSYDSVGTATMREAVDGATRRTLALERAIRDTAGDFIADLEDLGFPSDMRADEGPVRVQPAPRRAPIVPDAE